MQETGGAGRNRSDAKAITYNSKCRKYVSKHIVEYADNTSLCRRSFHYSESDKDGIDDCKWYEPNIVCVKPVHYY